MLCIVVSLYAALPKLFPRLGPTVFQDNRIDGNCPEKPVPPALHFCIAPPKPFPRFTIFTMHARSSGVPASLPPAPAELFPRFTVHPRSSGASVSLPPAEIPPSYFQAISRLSTPSALVPSFLPSFPLSFLPSFLPSHPALLSRSPRGEGS